MSIVLEDQFCCSIADFEIAAVIAGVLGNAVDCFVVTSALSVLWLRNWASFVLSVNVILSFGFNVLLKALFRIERPQNSCLDGFGFPSGDTQSIAALATHILVVYNIGVFNIVLLVSAVLVEAISRVLLGHHSVIDVVFGVIFGSVVGLATGLTVRSCAKRRKQKN